MYASQLQVVELSYVSCFVRLNTIISSACQLQRKMPLSPSSRWLTTPRRPVTEVECVEVQSHQVGHNYYNSNWVTIIQQCDGQTDRRTIDWLIEHGFTSAPTQYRLYGRRFLQVWWPNQQCQSTEGGWLVIQTGINLTMLTSPCYNTTTCMQI